MGENDLAVEEIDYGNPPFPLTAIDRELLAMKDEDFHEITWDDLKAILARNSLADLKRRPSDLRRYLAWSHKTKQAYGGMTAFVIAERLFWKPQQTHQQQQQPNQPTNHETSTQQAPSPPSTTASSPQFSYTSPIPFTSPSDYAILPNDWPYGFHPSITHLLIWSKTPIAVDMSRGGDVTAESRARIEEFVRETFAEKTRREDGTGAGNGIGDGMGEAEDRVLWFKNWVSLQSVRGVDHVHVLVRDAPEGLVRRWTTRRDL